MDEAEACYREALLADPGHADVLHLLGVVAADTGRFGLSVELIGEAINLNNPDAFYFSNLANALHALEQFDEISQYASGLSSILIMPGASIIAVMCS